MSTKQLIFVHTFAEHIPIPPSSGDYIVCWTAWDVIQHVRLLIRTLGLGDGIKTAIKVMTGRRKYFVVTDHGEGVHWGWISISFCRYYPIQTGDVVIGPIETLPQARGRGFATFALAKSINLLIDKGYVEIFIDTAETNYPCLKVIKNCQFGDPIGSFYK